MANKTAAASKVTTVESTTPVNETSTVDTATIDASSEGSEPVVISPAEILAGLDKSMEPQEGDKATSPYINKNVIGGKTVDIILLLNKDFVATRQQRVKDGPSDHAAFHFMFNGVPKHGFLTKAEYDLIKSTKKVCDIPGEDEIVDKYHEFLSPDCDPATRVVAAVKLRMSLTAEGNVKAA